MAAGSRQGRWEKFKEFFTQGPADFEYEEAGGDAETPEAERTNDPLADANEYARGVGEPVPWPSHVRTASGPWEGIEKVFDAAADGDLTQFGEDVGVKREGEDGFGAEPK